MKCGCKEKGTDKQCEWCGKHAIDWDSIKTWEAYYAGCEIENLPRSSFALGEANEKCVAHNCCKCYIPDGNEERESDERGYPLRKQ